MKESKISIAIVKNSEDLFLISLRPEGVEQGGKWEFPGGKVEQGECTEHAMCRELQEEVGITAIDYQLLTKKIVPAGDCQLHLYFYLVSQFSGQAFSKEGQPIKWVSKAELVLHSFPKANSSVIAQL